MFTLLYSNSPDNLYESQCGFIDKLWILNSYFKYHNSSSHPWNAFITKILALDKMLLVGWDAAEAQGSHSLACPPSAPLLKRQIAVSGTAQLCSGKMFSPSHMTNMASGQRHQSWNQSAAHKWNQGGNEEISVQHQTQGSPSLQTAIFGATKITFKLSTFLGHLHLYQTFYVQLFPVSLLGQPGWLGWRALIIFSSHFHPFFYLLSAASKSEDFFHTSVMTWEKTKLLDWFLKMELWQPNTTFHIHVNFFQQTMIVSKIPYFWLQAMKWK